MKIIGPSSAHLQEHPGKTLELYNRVIMLIVKKNWGQLYNVQATKLPIVVCIQELNLKELGLKLIVREAEPMILKSNGFLVRGGGVTDSQVLNFVRPPF
jgi:hypothetical protein